MRRVVVTGMGVVSPVGISLDAVWENLTSGSSGIGNITLFDASDFDVRIAGQVWDFDPLDFLPPKEARRMDRFTLFAMAGLEQALSQSGQVVNPAQPYRVGAYIGSGVGGIDTYTRELDMLALKGPRRVNPFLIPSITVDVPSVQVAIRTGARGPNLGVASACATGADAVGMAYELIRSGRVDAMFTGGVEAAVTPIGIAAFDRMRALSHRNDAPTRASRPFDADRDGFVMAEGGAILVLEELEYALGRGAEPLAEVLAYSATSDASHLSAPDIYGESAAVCMRTALEMAGLAPQDIDYLNAHGTSTPIGDLAETRAIKSAFGSTAFRLQISSTKSMTGHMLAGAGAFEALVCVSALRTGIIPGTINLDRPGEECDLDYVALASRRAPIRRALTNSMGFGGHNAVLIFEKWD